MIIFKEKAYVSVISILSVFQAIFCYLSFFSPWLPWIDRGGPLMILSNTYQSQQVGAKNEGTAVIIWSPFFPVLNLKHKRKILCNWVF